ncbi:Transcriptional regulatory protein AfsQ1 [Polaromonas vacuolata]|uniref:Transcriptional regulatory protein AfsQ1 n=1 Tax=Polaromonas vacuolata TaxID=37448 RepID=A0A6H2H9U0_9BURK|nr:response regulator [Polaromonas vacuolata]QJC56590.1 Transcriptional regulatory protein AfsQ1 [Polaromonas vacuolata]
MNKDPTPLPQTSAQRNSVLIIDDEPGVRWSLQHLLESNGYAVASAASGIEALKSLKTAKYCIVLVDAKLPDIDGIDLARRIRIETPCQAPLILVSGYFYDDDVVVREVLRSGLFTAFATKPIVHETLIRLVKVALLKL